MYRDTFFSTYLVSLEYSGIKLLRTSTFTHSMETVKTHGVRLDYDATGTHPHWVEIDAMKVSGKKQPDESIDITAVCQLCEHYANECNLPKCIFHKT